MVYFRKFDPARFHRRSIRLRGHDYRLPGSYFITLLTADPDDFFGTIRDGVMVLNEFGAIAESVWNDLPNHNPHISVDVFVIMPDHVHGILVIHDHGVCPGACSQPSRGDDPIVGAGSKPSTTGSPSNPALTGHGLPEIIRQFKTFSARRINALREKTGTPVWRRNYYEHRIHSQKELSNIRHYINNNPVRAGSKPARGSDTSVRAGSKPARETAQPARETAQPARTTNGILSVVGHFQIRGTPSGFSPIGSGHINDSYLITTTATVRAGSKPARETAQPARGSDTSVRAGSKPARDRDLPGYVLQQINHAIFRDIPGLIGNIDMVTRHMRRNLEASPADYPRMKVLELIPAKEGKLFFTDADENFWRLYSHIPGSHSYDRVESPELAYEGGRAFGLFQVLTSDLPPDSLTETIPRFHDIAWRMEQFEDALRKDPVDRVSRIPDLVRFIRDRAGTMHTLHRLLKTGQLPIRVTHNDSKFNNILFNADHKAVCIVDLDTVMPGTVLFDFGDAIRTGANTAVEDEPDLSQVELDLELYRAYTEGFLETAGRSLTDTERRYMAHSAQFMTCLIGLRFLTDYINGDTYFKVGHPEHNLQRARVQFRLVERMEGHHAAMKACIPF